MKKRIEFIFFGKVQNIAFRHFTKIIAGQIRINGVVKNNHDGSVTAVVEGEEDKISTWLDMVKTRHLEAIIEKFTHRELPIDKEFEHYSIIE